MIINKLLFVCSGNVCRSPMAEGYFKYNLVKQVAGLQVSSAGITALVGEEPVVEAQEVMSKHGINISAHRARQINQQMLLNTDLVLVMEEFHKQHIEQLIPHILGRVFLLGHWGDYEIPDPFRKPIVMFEQCFQLIEKSCREWKQKLC